MDTILTRKINIKKYYSFFLIIPLTIVVVFQLLGVSNDFKQYVFLFSNTKQRMEPFWSFLRYVNINTVNNFLVIIFFTTFFSLFIKFELMDEESLLLYFVFIIYYFLTFYWLHEYTQFRATLAIAFFSISYKYYEQNQKKLVLIYLLCIIIHYSCLILLPLVLFIKIENKKFYLFFPSFLFIFAILFSNILRSGNFLLQLLSLLDLDFITNVIRLKLGHIDSSFTVFNKLYLLFLFILYISYYIGIDKREKVDSKYMYSFKLLSYSLSLFYIFSCTPFPVMAMRFSEFFLPFGLLLLVFNFKYIKEKFLYFLLTFGIIMIMSLKLLQKTGRL